MPFPEIDPILIQIGPIAIRWYALAYIAGILFGAYYIKWLNKKSPVLKGLNPFDDLLVWSVFGIILGGRIGYILFYNPAFYFSNPLEILKVWHGGMSFHGGFLGMVVAMYYFGKKTGYSFWTLIELCACAAPIGLFLGRVANFINAELYGRTTDFALGVVFPGGGNLPRHPSQLYEAALEGVLLFIILFIAAAFTKARQKHGVISGLFLIGYGGSRFVVEFFREPDTQLGFFFSHFTMGQLLSLPMIMLGIFLVFMGLNGAKKTS